LLRHDIVLDFNGRDSSALQLSHRPHDIDSIAEAVFGIDHEAHVGDAGDPATVIDNVGHIGEYDIRDGEIRHFADRSRQHADLIP